MSEFDEDLIPKGLEQRKATLGADYVETNLAAADDFTRPFQEAMTAWCWGGRLTAWRSLMISQITSALLKGFRFPRFIISYAVSAYRGSTSRSAQR